MIRSFLKKNGIKSLISKVSTKPMHIMVFHNYFCLQLSNLLKFHIDIIKNQRKSSELFYLQKLISQTNIKNYLNTIFTISRRGLDVTFITLSLLRQSLNEVPENDHH